MSARDDAPSPPAWRDPGWTGLLLLALVCFIAPLGDGSLRGDSALYAAIARRMAETGDWLDMHVGLSPAPYFNKPPLLIWLAAGLFRLAGASTFTACFWSGAFGVASCLALYRLGRDALGRDAALYAACAFALTPDVLAKSTRFRLESACAFFLIVALHQTYLAVTRRCARPLALAGAAIGACFLAKGGPGFIALACALGFLLWSRSASLLLSRQAALGLVLMLGLALAWPLAQGLRHGDAYFEAAIGSELVRRVSNPRAYHPLPYLGQIGRRYWPWLPIFVLGAWRLARQGRHESPAAFRLLASWIALSLALLSLPAGKSGRYLLSVYPALSLVSGAWLGARVPAHLTRRFAKVLPKLALASAVALVCLPIPLRSDRAADVRTLGALLESFQPEQDAVVGYGRLRADVRPQIYFYLGRDLRLLRDAQAVDAEPSEIVIAHGAAGRELERAGWGRLLRSRRWSAYLRPPRPGAT